MRPTQHTPISVIVCTRDRTKELETCVRSLLAQDYPAFEVIIVDNAPADERTSSLCRTLPVRYCREPVRGLSYARNRGIREAKHKIIAFTDDDSIADSHWLSALAEAFQEPTVMAVTGRVEPAELATRSQKLFERAGGMSKGPVSRAFRRDGLSHTQLIGVQRVGVGANMAFRASVFGEIGEFDTRLGAGSPARGADDLDIFHRVIAANLELRYDAAAVVYHRHRAEMAGLREQLFDSGCGFGVYLLTLLRGRSVPRLAVLRYTLLSWAPWLMGRLLKGMLGLHPLPVSMLWAQIAGALHAPAAFRASRRRTAPQPYS